MDDEVARRRDQLLEAAAEADDDVLTKYLEGEEISDAELEACLRKGVKESILAPVLVGSAAHGHRAAGAARRDRPLPPLARRRGPRSTAVDKSGAAVEVAPDPNGPLLARVFKTAADPFVGRLTYLRVLSGTLHSQGHAWNASAARTSASASCCSCTARSRSRSASSRPARSARSRSSSVTATGDTLSSKEKPLTLPPLTFPEPTLVVAIEPQTKADLDKMGPALQRMLEEEPSARVERTDAGEQILRTTATPRPR